MFFYCPLTAPASLGVQGAAQMPLQGHPSLKIRKYCDLNPLPVFDRETGSRFQSQFLLIPKLAKSCRGTPPPEKQVKKNPSWYQHNHMDYCTLLPSPHKDLGGSQHPNRTLIMTVIEATYQWHSSWKFPPVDFQCPLDQLIVRFIFVSFQI